MWARERSQHKPTIGFRVCNKQWMRETPACKKLSIMWLLCVHFIKKSVLTLNALCNLYKGWLYIKHTKMKNTRRIPPCHAALKQSFLQNDSRPSIECITEHKYLKIVFFFFVLKTLLLLVGWNMQFFWDRNFGFSWAVCQNHQY